MKSRSGTGICGLVLLAVLGPVCAADTGAPNGKGAGDRLLSTAQAIHEEATLPNDSPEGFPLPLVSSWNAGVWGYPGTNTWGWRPAHQLELIRQGHHVLPVFSHPLGAPESNSFTTVLYREPVRLMRECRLPLTFMASQWEAMLSSPPYLNLPPDGNPNVVSTNGAILPVLDPFGPVALWVEAGRWYTTNLWMTTLQEWYPDPPLVIFLSNNEASKLAWSDAEKSSRYLAKYGRGRNDEFKRKVFADGWIERYRALQQGMREGLTEKAWKTNAIFVGYSVTELACFGRWGGWPYYSLHSAGRIDPGPLMWDGGSPSYYTDDWSNRRDNTMWSPQLEFMNEVFMLKRAHALNPRFWFELSTWDGYDGPEREKECMSPRQQYRLEGQTYNPQRYEGFIQFGMWLMRPRAVREYRGTCFPWNDSGTWEGAEPYYMALVKSVDRVYANSKLKDWWRKGELVPNRAHQHPYQSEIPPEYRQEDRWFLLDADTNPTQYPWELHWSVPVYSLALSRGKAPDRQWLVYAHAPKGVRKGVRVTIPDYREIVIDVPTGGAFYEVDERQGSVVPIEY